MTLFANILVIACLILLNGVLALSEMAVVACRRARLTDMVAQGRRGARTALQLVDDPSRLLSTVQVGITLVGVLAGAFGGATLAAPLAAWLHRFGIEGQSAYNLAFALVVALTTYLSLIIGELVPKYIALRQPEQITIIIAGPMLFLARAVRPVVWFLDTSTRTVLLLFGSNKKAVSRVTEGEVRSMIRQGTAEGVFDPREQAMIDGVLRLDDRSARSVMVPRPDVVWLDIHDDQNTIYEKIAATGFSRFLVCRGEIDEIAGMVRTRDMLDALMRGDIPRLADCMVEPMVVLDSTPVISLIDQFKNAHMHMAVVVDEYGSMVGVVTMTDVVEVIAGDLPEHWEDENEEAILQEDGSWLVDGMMDIGDFETTLGLRGVADSKDYHTVAGFVLDCAESVPSMGEHVYWRDIRLEVVAMDGKRIDKVLVTPTVPYAANSAAGPGPGDNDPDTSDSP